MRYSRKIPGNWAKLFMTNDFRVESTLLNALSDFQTTVKDSILIELEKIVCWGYEKREKFSQIKTLSKARVKLYTKQKVNSDRRDHFDNMLCVHSTNCVSTRLHVKLSLTY